MNKPTRSIFIITALVICTALQAAAATLKESIDAYLADPVLVHGIQGVVIESVKDGRVLYERNKDLVFVPASNMKLLVSAAAIDRLGPAYTYMTQIYSTGELSNETLSGDLVIKGAGDPLLSTADLKVIVQEIKSSGVKRIRGRIIGDDTKFDDVRYGWGWSWDDESYYYCPQISALALNGNVVQVYVSPAEKPGAKPIIKLDPATTYLQIVNQASTGPADSEKTLNVERLHGKNIIRITGSIPVGAESKEPEEPITVDEPALYAATILRQILTAEGINVTGGAAMGKLQKYSRVIASHASVPLREIVSKLNKPSDNLIAEMLLKTLGAEIKSKGTAEAGREVEAEFLLKAGLDPGAISIVDGSGLSRQDYISPENIVRLLKFMHKHQFAADYISSLPIAGVDGTLKRRMKGTAAENNVRAKTGYVSRVSSLSGYVKTKSGEQLVFSILMNNHLCRNSDATAVQNKICEYLANLE